ncbi:hypothetical protein [Jannaschia sp. 2305UL9-9]|uniref:hypothetical protein n=1 Tax=Jannaschia sp. 2305UL9-9 TaxID=3121638 RepID=UPI003528A6EA
MTRLSLEDFGRPKVLPPAVPPELSVGNDDFDTAYNAGWDDAMAQVDEEQGRIGEKLADRLMVLERDQQSAVVSAIAALEPMLHEVFDKLLPRAAERAFIGVLLEELQTLLSDGAGKLMLQVAPEETAPLARLVERAGLTPDQVTIRAEPALAISQALVRWDDQERRIDLEAVLAVMDEALETFLASVKVEPVDD